MLLSAADTSRVTNLAAIADSLDYLADMIQGAVLEYNEHASAEQDNSVTPRQKSQKLEMVNLSVSRGHPATLNGLDDLVDRLLHPRFLTLDPLTASKAVLTPSRLKRIQIRQQLVAKASCSLRFH